MKNKDTQLLEEAYGKVIEAMTLKDPSLSDEQSSKLVARHNELKVEIKKLRDKMAESDYEINYGPHDRVGHVKLLKELEQKIQALRKKYYGGF